MAIHATDRAARAGAPSAPLISKTDARQAVAPHQLRYMLIIGTIAVIVGFAVVYMRIA
ncbi:hypothetical protein OSH11_09920 [Kaistia dalseonensis]|uniref:Uncharacterized protein n=1 Tax=Kaistia dalseonensis TaxID=410840 RepID=A0ABU0H5L8_9HYPH|nr:hypothetical protein [Kaistia dalseonensis]MCX5495021.1 hypothetical protein [Kaistia dalseonensis]MDQ0437602.1 hypothetical protein [Kaistia dalseonensis]